MCNSPCTNCVFMPGNNHFRIIRKTHAHTRTHTHTHAHTHLNAGNFLPRLSTLGQLTSDLQRQNISRVNVTHRNTQLKREANGRPFPFHSLLRHYSCSTVLNLKRQLQFNSLAHARTHALHVFYTRNRLRAVFLINVSVLEFEPC